MLLVLKWRVMLKQIMAYAHYSITDAFVYHLTLIV